MEYDDSDKLHGFGPRLTAAIAAARTTSSQLARELNVTPQAIYNLETRDGGVGSARLFRIADLLNTDPSWLALGRVRPIVALPGSATAPPTTLGERLDQAMRQAGHATQTSLSAASGVPQATISRVLSNDGSSGPESETVRKLARACAVTAVWLAEGADDGAVPYALNAAQCDWLTLLDHLGSDDIAEFSALIAQRQARNRKLLAEIVGPSHRPIRLGAPNHSE
jgi:transcriptional regulator with XRE-family HTH domain